MKCDELKDRWFWAYPTESVDCDGITGSAHEVYGKSEVDEAIAELKTENESLKAKLETVNELVKTSKDMYDHAIESQKATHDTEMMDAGMRERRLRRALWVTRGAVHKAKRLAMYGLLQAYPLWEGSPAGLEVHKNIHRYEGYERKCLKKAEEYK